MDCAINAAVTSAVGTAGAGGQQAGSATLCDMGKRFAELVQQAPTGAGAPAITPPSAIVETYVPAVTNTSAGSGGALLVSGIDQIGSLMPLSLGGQEGGMKFGDDGLVIDEVEVMNRILALQFENTQVMMVTTLVSSMNTGVKTLFQQQG
jgi:hypothetical protein